MGDGMSNIDEIIQSIVKEIAQKDATIAMLKAEIEANAKVFETHNMTMNAYQSRKFLNSLD